MKFILSGQMGAIKELLLHIVILITTNGLPQKEEKEN